MIGYVNKENTTDEHFYFVKDHLLAPPSFWRGGSVRLTLNGSGIESGTDYYAYSGISRSISNGEQKRYDFTKKERDTETGLNYFGARYYDSEGSFWYSVDPLADKYPGWSPYNYTLCNPLKFTDPNGDTVKIDPALLEKKPEWYKMVNRSMLSARTQNILKFQDYWANNGSKLENLFGIGGKFENVNINFNLGLSPDLNSSTGRGLYATTRLTFHSDKDLDYLWGFTKDLKVNSGDKFSDVNNLNYFIYINPGTSVIKNNTVAHEINYHVLNSLEQIYDAQTNYKRQFILKNYDWQHRNPKQLGE